jgi:uncharacterized protein (TIGR03435 family)
LRQRYAVDRNISVDLSPVTALAELGLKLAPAKDRVEILCIDRLEKPGKN